jgi:hypothetical protein
VRKKEHKSLAETCAFLEHTKIQLSSIQKITNTGRQTLIHNSPSVTFLSLQRESIQPIIPARVLASRVSYKRKRSILLLLTKEKDKQRMVIDSSYPKTPGQTVLELVFPSSTWGFWKVEFASDPSWSLFLRRLDQWASKYTSSARTRRDAYLPLLISTTLTSKTRVAPPGMSGGAPRAP